MPKEIDKETLFPYKLNEILHNNEAVQFISWGKESNSIEITDLKGFQENVLPLYFRHGRFESFVRQMNLYGFKKHRNSKIHVFTHEMLDNQKNLLCLKSRYQMRRQNLTEEQNKQAQFSNQEVNENGIKIEPTIKNTIENHSPNQPLSIQEFAITIGYHQQYENLYNSNTFPLMNPYYFYTWTQNCPQINYLPINGFQSTTI